MAIGRRFALLSLTLAVASLAGLMLSSRQRLRAQSFAPLLPLGSGLGLNPPLLEEALRDPGLKPVSDDIAAEGLRNDIDQAKADILHTSGERRTELAKQLFEDYGRLAFYLEDLASGKIKSLSQEQLGQNLADAQRQFITAAVLYGKTASDARAKARAVYTVAVASYLSGHNQASAVRELEQIDRSLNSGLQKRAALVRDLYALDHSGPTDRLKAQHHLRILAGALPRNAAAVAHLALARSLAGLNARGFRVSKASPAYRGQLAIAMHTSLSSSQKHAVLSYAIAVWRHAEGAHVDWAHPPFNLRSLADMPESKALIERSALDDWRKNDSERAIRKYTALAKSFDGDNLMPRFDERVLAMRHAQYLASKDGRAYEATLRSLRAKYNTDADGQSPQFKAFASTLQMRHKQFVVDDLSAAKRANANNAKRNEAITFGTRYLELASSPAEKEAINADIASIYALKGEHEKAVAIYLDLALNASVAGRKVSYLNRAASSQRVLAHWPQVAPWPNHGAAPAVKLGFNGERQSLLDIYNKLAEAGEQNWPTLAQIGQLQLALGHRDDAFQLWQKALKTNPRGSDAERAAGVMLTSHEQEKEWAALEDTARLCLAAQVTPRLGVKALSAREFFGDALLGGGREALTQEQPNIAVRKLEEFTKTFRERSDRDEGLFLLASAYRGVGSHPKAIAALVELVTTYPRSGYLHDGLLEGGDWSVSMAFEDNAMFFYRTYLDHFAASNEAPRVREELAPLYLGRGYYAEALTVLREQTRAKNASETQVANATQEILRIDDRDGSATDAKIAASKVLKSRDADPASDAEAVLVLARQSQNDGGALSRYEARLAGLDQSVAEVQDALGEVRFMEAEHAAKGLTSEVVNITQKDPSGALEAHYAAYDAARKAYLRVCDVGHTSYCAPALDRLARLAENMGASLQDLDLPDTLDAKAVQTFRARKDSILATLTKTSEDSDARALAVLQEGYTNPDWVQQILWHNTSDWNFDRVSGESGSGYLQWTAKD